MAHITIGFEEGCTPASDKARVAPIISELQARGVDARRITRSDRVNIRIVNELDPRRVWNDDEIRILNISDNVLVGRRPCFSPFFYPTPTVKHLYFYAFVRRRLVRALGAFKCVVAASTAQVVSFQHYRFAVRIPDVAYYLDFAPEVNTYRACADERLIFVWDGQGANFPYLEALISEHLDFFRRTDVLLRVVTDKFDAFHGRDNERVLASLNVNSVFVPWVPDSFVLDVAQGHVGLAPLDLSCPFSRSKPENKAVNYLSLGMLAVCSATSAYKELSRLCPAVSICETKSDWRSALERVLSLRKEFRVLGQRGLEVAGNYFGQQPIGDRWLNVLRAYL